MLRLGYLVIVLVALLSLGIGPSAPDHHPIVRIAHAVVIDKIALSGCVAFTAQCAHTGWNGTTSAPNPTITVHQGDNVSLTLTTNDTSAHQFLFDTDMDTTDTSDCPAIDPCSAIIPTGGTVKYSFIENAPPLTTGQYTYYCVFHPAQMNGRFIVLSSTVGGTAVPPGTSNPAFPTFALVAILLLTVVGGAALYAGREKAEVHN